LKIILILFLFSINIFAAEIPQPLIPDPQLTTGYLCSTKDNNFHEYRYREKIPYCKRNVSSAMKREIYLRYRIPAKCQSDYTIDHFYPLSLGGNNQFANLWPEHKAIKKIRQNLEQTLYENLRDGEITQARALSTIKEAKLNPDSSTIAKGNYCEQFSPLTPLPLAHLAPLLF